MIWIDVLTAKLPTWEATVPWLYLDNAKKPNATTAQGFLVASLVESLKLPWRTPDGTTPASASQVALDWNRVVAMRGGMLAGRYKTASSLLMAESDMTQMTRTFVANSYAGIKSLFPEFDSFPLPAQVGVGDLAYNPGVPRLRSEYVNFCRCVMAKDWSAAAKECGRNSWMPAFAARNAWTAGLFAQAAALSATSVQPANLTA